MFKVILNGIRCYSSSEFIFKEGKVTLIKGKSGIGKSTILDAITWCLYAKIRGIKNKYIEKETYSVELIFKDFSILRQVNPKIFRYTENSRVTYEGEAAQSLINKKFGTEDLWYSCSYIEQKKLCPLLYGNNAERMSLLNNLSFWLDNPEKVLDTIDEKIKACQQEYEILSKIYIGLNESFNSDIIKKPIQYERIEHFISKWKLTKGISVLNILTDCETQMKSLRKKIEEASTKRGNLEVIKQELHKCNEEINRLLSEIKDKSPTEDNLLDYYEYKCKEQSRLISELITGIDSITTKLRELEGKELKIASIRVSIASLSKEKLNLEDNLKGIISDLQAIKSRKEEVANEIATLKSKIPANMVDKNILIQDYINLKEIESKIAVSKQLALQVGVNYDIAEVKTKKKQLEDTIIMYNNLMSLLFVSRSIDSIKLRLSSFTDVKEVTEEDINQAVKKYQEYIKRKDIILCPHCRGSLRFVSGNLQKDDGSIVKDTDITSASKEIEVLKLQRNKFIEFTQLNQELNKMIDILKAAGIEYSTLTQQNEEEIRSRLSQCKVILDKLSGISFEALEGEGTSDDYLNIIKYKDLLVKFNAIPDTVRYQDEIISRNSAIERISSEILALEQELASLGSNSEVILSLKAEKVVVERKIVELRLVASEYERKCSIFKIAVSRKKELSVTAESLENSLDKGSELELEYQRLEEKYNDIQILKSDVEYRNTMLEKNKDILTKYEEVERKKTYILSLGNLRKKAYDLQCIQLQTTVDNINNTLNAILSDIFEDPIRVILKLSKKNKSNNRIIPSVSFSIFYKGMDYDGISELSGGEQDRISIALTLALSSVNGSPFLMLDETMSSLDSKIRESCIQAMKSHIPHSKTILCINHEDIDGNYDDVLVLS